MRRASSRALVASNHWGNSWRNGIFDYHHYHSTAHEVLVAFSGWATVQFGGDSGTVQRIEAGDAVLIPAGVAHKRIESGGGFAVVGAYPWGQSWDLLIGKAGERPKADESIARVPLPKADPLFGPVGPLLGYWRA